jgi:Sulfotransferase family
MIGNDRLIIVLGMAHSGTTILTYTLQQHPDVVCGTSGPEAWLFENDWLMSEQTALIQEILDNNLNKKVLLKRPWVCVDHRDYLVREMPNAKFIYCYRDFFDISMSWSKPTSFVGANLRSDSEFQRKTYDETLKAGEILASKVPFFIKIYHKDFVNHPSRIMRMITEWVGLSHFNFDLRFVSYNKDIKLFLRR